MDMTPYTWEMLGTIAGATAATLLIVQYLKDILDKALHVPTRLLVLLVALLILLGAQAFTAGLTWSDAPLILLNAFLVAFAAMGAYETALGERMIATATLVEDDDPPDSPDNPE